MKLHRLAMTVTIVNIVLFVVVLTRGRSVSATSVPAVLRARALELVDYHGRVRAEIKVVPAEPALKMPDGTVGYPETVQLRLIDSSGSPNVKLAATEDGSGLVLGGQSGYVQILSRKESPFVKLVDKDGRQQLFELRRRP
jgi:hypothetical protein